MSMLTAPSSDTFRPDEKSTGPVWVRIPTTRGSGTLHGVTGAVIVISDAGHVGAHPVSFRTGGTFHLGSLLVTTASTPRSAASAVDHGRRGSTAVRMRGSAGESTGTATAAVDGGGGDLRHRALDHVDSDHPSGAIGGSPAA
jgi:hypothetical protein